MATDTATSQSTKPTPDQGLDTLSPARRQLVDDVMSLYRCDPNHARFRHYEDNAVFEDPISYMPGIGAIKAAFFGMPKVFSSSVTDSLKVVENTPERLQVDIVQDYQVRGLGNHKVLPSSLVFKFKPTGDGSYTDRIVLHQDLWNGEPLPRSSDGLWGKAASAFRSINGRFISFAISVPKDD